MFILFIAISSASYRFINYYQTPSFYGVIMNQINLSILGFALLYIQLLIIGDIYDNSNIEKHNEMVSNKKEWLSDSLIYSAVLCFIVILIFLLANFLLCLLLSGSKFKFINLNEDQSFGFINLLPIIIIYLRLLCMSNINFGANLLFKNPVGFVIPLIISLTEWVLGRTVLMDDPNGILPINNTEIVGNKIYGEYINYDTFLKPIIYWVIIIVVTIIFINLIYKLKVVKELNNDNSKNKK
jgi:hypothetical protein